LGRIRNITISSTNKSKEEGARPFNLVKTDLQHQTIRIFCSHRSSVDAPAKVNHFDTTFQRQKDLVQAFTYWTCQDIPLHLKVTKG